MKVAYFDCFSGISGNMILGAFIDAGLDIDSLKNLLSKMPIKGYELEIKKVAKKGISAMHLDVKVIEKQPHRHLRHIREIIAESNIPNEVKELALQIFTRLAEAEAKIHGTTVDKVHFHEVGAVDAIVDIVGAAFGVYSLGIDKVYASPLNVGKGMVRCAHGLMPIPAPATAELLKDAVTYSNDIQGELVTPTGAAILTTLTEHFAHQPALKIHSVSYGAGTWDLSIPNVLRLTIGEETNENAINKAQVIETNIDDMNPEFYEYLTEKLFQAGAVDVYFMPIQMKKNRPGTLVSVISTQRDNTPIFDVLFKESTTLGIRMYPCERVMLAREYQKVVTQWGEVTIKLGKYNGKLVNVKPEYDQCKRIAAEQNIPLKEVWQKVIDTYNAAK